MPDTRYMTISSGSHGAIRTMLRFVGRQSKHDLQVIHGTRKDPQVTRGAQLDDLATRLCARDCTLPLVRLTTLKAMVSSFLEDIVRVPWMLG